MLERLTGPMATNADKNLFWKNVLVLLSFNAEEVVSLGKTVDKNARATAIGIQVDQQLDSTFFFTLTKNQFLFVNTNICPDKKWPDEFIQYVQDFRFKEIKSNNDKKVTSSMNNNSTVDNHISQIIKNKEEIAEKARLFGERCLNLVRDNMNVVKSFNILFERTVPNIPSGKQLKDLLITLRVATLKEWKWGLSVASADKRVVRAKPKDEQKSYRGTVDFIQVKYKETQHDYQNHMTALFNAKYDGTYTDYWLTLLFGGTPVTHLISKEECKINPLLSIKDQFTHEDFSFALSKSEISKSCREASIAANKASKRNSTSSTGTSLTANGDNSSSTDVTKHEMNLNLKLPDFHGPEKEKLLKQDLVKVLKEQILNLDNMINSEDIKQNDMLKYKQQRNSIQMQLNDVFSELAMLLNDLSSGKSKRVRIETPYPNKDMGNWTSNTDNFYNRIDSLTTSSSTAVNTPAAIRK